MTSLQVSPIFWKNKKVFITGLTGFKGSWLSCWLHLMGAKIFGYSLMPNTDPAIFDIVGINQLVYKSQIADIRNLGQLKQAITSFSPDVVIHMAAQPLVSYSYEHPIETYEVNILGTANLLEAIRGVSSVGATVIVTTDKCYENQEHLLGYREDDPMGGYDPYSSSKGCAELIVNSYRRSFFSPNTSQNAIASVRAGNVIGGGDWSRDRLIPDAIRAFTAGQSLLVRNPLAVRPWQHVLEPLSGYLLLAQSLYEGGHDFASGWNFGSNDSDARPVREIMDLFVHQWGKGASWEQDFSNKPHEARLLMLNCSKAKSNLGWSPKWPLEVALQKTIDWHQAYLSRSNMLAVTRKQIENYHNSGKP